MKLVRLRKTNFDETFAGRRTQNEIPIDEDLRDVLQGLPVLLQRPDQHFHNRQRQRCDRLLQVRLVVSQSQAKFRHRQP